MKIGNGLNQDPNFWAQQYAQKNGLSADDAKSHLESIFGRPNPPVGDRTNINANGSIFSGPQMPDQNPLGAEGQDDIGTAIKDLIGRLLNLLKGNNGPQNEGDPIRPGEESASMSLPDQSIDPDVYAQQYADEHGISLEEAKTELKANFGDPQQFRKQ